ncbi:unnamed protein product [Gadus morhua 'NCC']
MESMEGVGLRSEGSEPSPPQLYRGLHLPLRARLDPQDHQGQQEGRGLGQTLFHASAPLSQRGPLNLTSGHSYDPMQMVSVISAQTWYGISSQELKNSPSQLMSYNALLCCSEKRVLSQRFPSFHSLFLARVGRPLGMSRPPEVLQKNRGLLSPGPAEPPLLVGTTARFSSCSPHVLLMFSSRSPPARLRFSSCSPHVLLMFSSCSGTLRSEIIHT